jgi:hypothetical protein
MLFLFFFIMIFYSPASKRFFGQPETSNKSGSIKVGSLASNLGRHLTDQQVIAIGNQLKGFASQKFWIIAETGEYAPESEQIRFGQQLRQALRLAFWIDSRRILQRMGNAGFQENLMYDYSKVGGIGILIFGAPDCMVAAKALDSALRKMGFNSSAERDDNLKESILIFIGAD